MGIRTRLALVLSATLAIVLALSALAIVTAEESRRMVAEPQLHNEALRRTEQFASEVSQSIKDLSDVVMGFEDYEELDAVLHATELSMEAVEEAARRDGSSDLLERAQKMRLLFEEIVATKQRIVELLRAGKRDEAKTLLITVAEERYEDEFLPLLAAARVHHQRESAELLARSERRAQRTTTISIALVGIGLLVVAVAAWRAGAIHLRITRLLDAVRAMGTGAFATRSPDTSSSDELGELARVVNRMAQDLEGLVQTKADKEALSQELALAARMQQEILPGAMRLPGLEACGVMLTATEVGGDYFDIRATDDGGWITIGDVSGHGFNAGMIMLMAQSAIAAAIERGRDVTPGDVLRAANRVLYDNVKARLGLRHHMTACILRYWRDGRIVYAGAHQDILIRDAAGRVRAVPTEGTWLALVPELGELASEHELQLACGETMVLFTDGLTEARMPGGGQYGIERLQVALAAARAPTGANELCAEIMASVWQAANAGEDDATLVVLRRASVDASA